MEPHSDQGLLRHYLFPLSLSLGSHLLLLAVVALFAFHGQKTETPQVVILQIQLAGDLISTSEEPATPNEKRIPAVPQVASEPVPLESIPVATKEPARKEKRSEPRIRKKEDTTQTKDLGSVKATEQQTSELPTSSATTAASESAVTAAGSGSSYDIPAHATEEVQPKIPAELREKEFKTSVRVRVDVDPTGIGEPSLRSSSGNEAIDELVLEALRQWKWEAASRNGKSVPSTLYFRFLLQVD